MERISFISRAIIRFGVNGVVFFFFFLVCQIVLQGQENRRVANVGEKSYRCEHEDCGKLYTTAHHLKVCSVNMFAVVLTSAAITNVWSYKLSLSQLLLLLFFLDILCYPQQASLMHLCWRRCTNARIPETSHTCANIRDAGRSLQQVGFLVQL